MKTSGCLKKSIYVFAAVVFMIMCLAVFGPLAEASQFGLVAEFSNVLVPTDNLNPGDVKTSVMTLSLEEADGYDISSLPAYIRSEIVSRTPSPNGGDLDERLLLTVRHESGDFVFEGHIGEFDENIYLGEVGKNDDMDLEFTIYLPGAETTNEYQGSSMRVKWIITAVYKEGSDDSDDSDESDDSDGGDSSESDEDDDGEDDDGEDQDKEEPKDNRDENEEAIPGAEPASRGGGRDDNANVETIEMEETIPAGLPNTGYFPGTVACLFGAAIALAGFRILVKNKK